MITLILIWLLLQSAAAVLVPINGTKPGCQDMCGDVSIPYPFGIGEGCYIGDWFDLSCNHTFNPPRPYYGRIPILDISVRDGEMKVSVPIATSCGNNDGLSWATLQKFTFSDTQNRFIAIGCNTIGYFSGWKNESYFTGCLSLCKSAKDVTDGSCNGIGCCETFLEKGLMSYNVTARGFYNRSTAFNFSPCSYAFVAEEKWFKFNKSYFKLNELNKEQRRVPAVLEWTVGSETCQDAKKNSTSYGCGPNTDCYESGNAPGYRCKCLDGYEGNPYLKGTTGGCQDVDECKTPNPCKGLLNTCKNTGGSHDCICQSEYREQRRNDGTLDCIKPVDQQLIKIIIGTCSGLLLLVVSSSCLYWVFKRQKLIKLKEKFFLQNGGLILQQLIIKREDDEVVVDHDQNRIAKIFTAEELNKATNNYDESRILGQGGYGTVYKGTLLNGNVVAIKKSKTVDRTQIEQFINEVVVLSQINHRNVVKLLGCCLETEVPLLVYEFVTNGTLFQHLHDRESENRSSVLYSSLRLSWDIRLRIAAEVAGSLAYLHSSASIPIIHRDVKSSNVLLDDNYTAKVSDFGASRLVPIDQTQLTTLVQGTLGYLDPEYFHTSQLTEKSDVYSFGVLLAELLTGKMALSLQRPEEQRNLAKYFLSSIEDDDDHRLFQILDDGLASELGWRTTSTDHDQQRRQQLKEVAELTRRCLRVKGEKRPTMKEAAMVLDGLRSRSSKDSWIFDAEPDDNNNNKNKNKEEEMHLLGAAGQQQDSSYTESSGYVTVDSQVMPVASSLLDTGR